MRYYLDRVSDNGALDALFPKLIATYPDTYDYYYRYGKNLVKRGQAEKALPYLEQAYAKSYGRNRLWVAQWRAQALMELDRGDEARALVAETLQANGPWFEKDMAVLKAVLDGQAPA
jgi:predicted Zn-dependent protease